MCEDIVHVELTLGLTIDSGFTNDEIEEFVLKAIRRANAVVLEAYVKDIHNVL